jgi:hypothetical protein
MLVRQGRRHLSVFDRILGWGFLLDPQQGSIHKILLELG